MAGELQEKNGISAGFVSYASNGATLDGYLARPSDGQAHLGVVLIQEWWGIEPHIKELTERLARAGYVVLAPDLYHGKVVAEPNEAAKAAMALDMGRAVAEIGKGVDYLRGRDDVQPKQVGVVGFCMGGQLAWKVAEAEGNKLAAVAPFYGAGYQPSAGDIRKVTAPALVIWGEQDGSVSAAQRQRITALLDQQGKTYKALLYPAGHAFMNDQHDAYDPASAQQAWSELLAWLKQHLG